MLGIGRGDAPDGGALESLRRRALGPAEVSGGGASRRCAAGPGDSALASARFASSVGAAPGPGDPDDDSGAIGGGGSPVAVSRISEPAGAAGVLGGVGGPGARSPAALGAP
jgi:hypothetical protein